MMRCPWRMTLVVFARVVPAVLPALTGLDRPGVQHGPPKAVGPAAGRADLPARAS